jgi:hypothetical protein
MEFVDYWPTKKDGSPFHYIRACYTKQVSAGSYEWYLPHIHITQIDLATLKKMKVWNFIAEDVKAKLESNTMEAPKNLPPKEVTVIKEPETKGRKRDPAFADLPRELVCSTEGCEGKMPYISPTILVAKAEEKGITPEEYAKTWKCAKCEPRKRGRQVSSELADLPRELKCSTEGCKEVSGYVSPTMLKQRAEEKGITIEEYIASWKCSTCEPRKRGRAATGKWDGFVSELACPCGFKTKQHPSVIAKNAEAAGMSYEDFVKAYRCRSCKPATTNTTTTRGRKMSPDSPWFGLAKEVKCTNPECGKVQKQHASITQSQADKAGKTFDEYVATWKCMACRPNGEKRGRGNTTTTTTTGTNIPNKTVCKGCNKSVNIVASNIIEKAAILGITPEELVNNYKCRSCGGKLKKADKVKHAEAVA